MKKKITLLALLLISSFGFAQVSYVFATGTGDWEIPFNWSPVGIPTSIDNVQIISGQTCTIQNLGAVCNVLIIDGGGTLEVASTASLTVDTFMSGSVTIDSDASNSGSVISNTYTGITTYQRYLEGGEWHLLSAPVSGGGVDVDEFIANHGAAMTQSGVKYSLGTYDNSFAPGSSAWKNYTSDVSNPAPEANFVEAQGYEILMDNNGTVDFTGAISTDPSSIGITENVSGWNLIGNPYPSSIYVNTNAHVTDNFLTVNSANLDPSYVSVYIWNPTSGSYDVVNQATAATSLAPGQAFFVKSNTGGATVNIGTAMRTHQSVNNFQKSAGSGIPTINLSVDNNTGTVKSTDIKYMSGTTLGLDAGYDAGQFEGLGNGKFNVYTNLVEDNGVNFSLQVVPDTDYDSTIIPIGVNANAGTEITFNANASDLPTGKKVYLEDKLLNTVTEINATDKAYTVTLDTDLSGSGRFYIYVHSKALSIDLEDTAALNYKLATSSDTNSVRLYGAVRNQGTLTIFDTFGRKLYTTTLQTGTEQDINVPSMSEGVYIVEFNIDDKSFSKKILWY